MLLCAPTALAVDKVDTSQIRAGVTMTGIVQHMTAFQTIANANNGTRAAATPGYDASLAYVQQRLEAAGYDPVLHEFDFAHWVQNGPALLQRQGQPAYTEGTDYVVAQFSGSGTLTNLPLATTNDITLAPTGDPGSGTSGCEVEDWGGQNLDGKIALIERGTCTFVAKIELAKSLGAEGVLIFNDGYPTRIEPFQIGAPPFIGIPVAMTSFGVGSALYNAIQAGGVNVSFNVDATTTEVTQYNLLADTGGNPRRTVVVGGHLDSVEEGPGINDNGSGTGSILELAEEIAERGVEPRNRIRFAFWGAEEAGLVGSIAYVHDLIASGEIKKIEANLNFDMLASPNFVRFVYDGDNSTGEGVKGPNGSDTIEQVFLDYFQSQGLPTEPTAFDGRSDYGEFIANGVPAGGLFSGAEGIKTAAEAATYGGAAGVWYDPCYHQDCDTLSTVTGRPPADADGMLGKSPTLLPVGNGLVSLDQLADGVAHATWTLANSTSALVSSVHRAPGAKVRAASAKTRKANRLRAKRLAYRGSFARR
jgi:Zn-dependent M28 family amino/carboxypeptidase